MAARGYNDVIDSKLAIKELAIKGTLGTAVAAALAFVAPQLLPKLGPLIFKGGGLASRGVIPLAENPIMASGGGGGGIMGALVRAAMARGGSFPGAFFSQGGRVPRSYNVRPGAGAGYYSQGGQVSNSTVVNAEINLTSTGSTARDVREIVRGINREAHRGGINVR